GPPCPPACRLPCSRRPRRAARGTSRAPGPAACPAPAAACPPCPASRPPRRPSPSSSPRPVPASLSARRPSPLRSPHKLGTPPVGTITPASERPPEGGAPGGRPGGTAGGRRRPTWGRERLTSGRARRVTSADVPTATNTRPRGISTLRLIGLGSGSFGLAATWALYNTFMPLLLAPFVSSA